MLKSLIKAALAAALIGLASPSVAATLYITEFGNGVGQVGTSVVQLLPQQSLVSQTVSIGASSTQSSAFGSGTHAVQVYCDTGCSIAFGSNPAATTATQVLTANQPQNFVVVPGQKIAVIANPSGGGGGGGTPVTVEGAANLSTAQVSVTGTATLVAAQRTGRQAVTVVNTGSTPVYVGNTASVTTSTGTYLPGIVGASITMNTQSAIYGIVATGTAVVTEFETY